MALDFDDTQSAVLLALLGLPEDTEDVQLVIETVKDCTRDPMLPPPPTDGTPADGIAAAAKKAGLEVIDASSAEALRRDAAEGRRLIAAKAQADVEAVVDAAIDKGKIAASRRKHWVSLIANDPGMAEVLAAVPDETAIPLRELGHASAKSDTQSNELADPSEWFYSA
jgi:hypothetical protein